MALLLVVEDMISVYAQTQIRTLPRLTTLGSSYENGQEMLIV